MDTILYFYRKRGLEKPQTEPVGLKAYLLIRIGLDVEEGRWFDRRWEQLPAAMAGHAVERKGNCGPSGHPYGIWDILGHPWKTIRLKQTERRERAQRLAQEQERNRLIAEREQLLGQMEEAIQRLALEVAELAGDMDSCLCVYEDGLRKALVSGRERALEPQPSQAQSPLPALWQKNFPVEEFRGYAQQFWVEQVFTQAMRFQAPPHFVILGMAPGLPQILEAHARRMKSLRWFLPSAEWEEGLSAFVEDFYTEYGLAIELQLVEDMAALKRLRPFSRESVNIVDFTGEAYMAVSAAPEGSVWLDMLSVEEKRRRIMAKGKKITYFSMKEIWKSAQKRCNCPLLP